GARGGLDRTVASERAPAAARTPARLGGRFPRLPPSPPLQPALASGAHRVDRDLRREPRALAAYPARAPQDARTRRLHRGPARRDGARLHLRLPRPAPAPSRRAP